MAEAVVNHIEAKELAESRQENSNLARCYLDLSRQLAEAQAELALWRASFPGSAEAVKRDALSNMRGT